MLSVICVYNNKNVVQANLLASLKEQNTSYDLVLVDNRKQKFKSAASALNYGFTKSNPKSRYIFFAHQDILLLSSTALADSEKILNNTRNLGIAGFAGKDDLNHSVGFVEHENFTFGRKMSKAKEVFSLDELGLIIPRNIFKKNGFDAITFDGWHCYGVDYCLWSKSHRFKAIVLPIPVRHNTTHGALADKKLLYYQAKLLEKYKNFRKIYTTNGTVSKLTLFIRNHIINDKLLFYYKERFLTRIKGRQ